MRRGDIDAALVERRAPGGACTTSPSSRWKRRCWGCSDRIRLGKVRDLGRLCGHGIRSVRSEPGTLGSATRIGAPLAFAAGAASARASAAIRAVRCCRRFLHDRAACGEQDDRDDHARLDWAELHCTFAVPPRIGLRARLVVGQLPAADDRAGRILVELGGNAPSDIDIWRRSLTSRLTSGSVRAVSVSTPPRAAFDAEP